MGKRILIEEREEIMKEVVEATSFQEEIASKINRNVSSISREIKRNLNT